MTGQVRTCKVRIGLIIRRQLGTGQVGTGKMGTGHIGTIQDR